jgi:hypothetical protein
MGEIFEGLMGNFNGYALEDSDFNTQSDDSDVDSFFNDDFGNQNEQVIDQKTIKKGRVKRIKKVRRSRESSGSFGGF